MKEKNKAAAWAKEIWHKYNFILIFLAILVVFLVINHGATTMTTLMNIPRHSTVIGIIALGMGLIILTGDIDLSVGSQLALVGGLTVMVFNSTNSIVLALVFAVGMGVVLGLINGLLVGENASLYRHAGDHADVSFYCSNSHEQQQLDHLPVGCRPVPMAAPLGDWEPICPPNPHTCPDPSSCSSCNDLPVHQHEIR